MNLYNKICVVNIAPDNKSYISRVVTDNGYIVQVRPFGQSFNLTIGKPLADTKFNMARVPLFTLRKE